MALYTISHSCGHETERQIYGTNVRNERGRKAAWFAGQPCTACTAAARQAEYTAENTLAAELAAAENLPRLTGTDRQVAWATTIRAAALDKLTARGAEQARLARTPEQHAELDALMGRCRAALVEQTVAAWWIDRRDNLNAMLRDAGVTR
jgi:hypothetical protein